MEVRSSGVRSHTSLRCLREIIQTETGMLLWSNLRFIGLEIHEKRNVRVKGLDEYSHRKRMAS